MSIFATLILVFGLFLFIASIILAGTVNRIFQFRVVPLVFGIIGMVIFIAGKYTWYIVDFVQNVSPPSFGANNNMDPTVWNNILHGRLFLVYMPDLLLLIMSLSLIFDKTKNFTKAVAPYGLFYGLIYLVASSLSFTNSSYIDSLVWYRALFGSDSILRMSGIGFIFLMLISLWTLITCREFSRWSMVSSILLGIVFIVYTFNVQHWYDCGANGFTNLGYIGLAGSTDTSKFPNYFASLTKLTKNTDVWVYLMLILPFIVAGLIFLFKNLFTKDIRRVNYIYKPWYYNNRVFNDLCSSIDATINDYFVTFFKTSYLFGLMSKDKKVIESFVQYTKNNNTPDNIDKDKVAELTRNLDAKQKAKEEKKKQKASKKNKIIKQQEAHENKAVDQELKLIDKEIQRNEQQQAQVTKNINANITNALSQNNIVQEWTDEQGTYWGLDNQGNYFYKYNNAWYAYKNQ